MSRKRVLQLSVLTSVGVALVLSACTVNVNMPGSNDPGMMNSYPAGEYSHQDLMFAEMMIPHHEQAVEMSEMALRNSTNSDILNLAGHIMSGQDSEIDQMQAWLDQSGGAGGHHGGHGMVGMGPGMGGMATDAQLDQLASLSSPEFDRLYLLLMIEHHEGALDMVRMIRYSSNDEVKALADDITSVQRAEIAEMRALLERL